MNAKCHQESGVTPREETENQSFYTGLISSVEVGNPMVHSCDPQGKCDHWEFLIQYECVMSTGRKGPVCFLQFPARPPGSAWERKGKCFSKAGKPIPDGYSLGTQRVGRAGSDSYETQRRPQQSSKVLENKQSIAKMSKRGLHFKARRSTRHGSAHL
jgi:hypothetical protein